MRKIVLAALAASAVVSLSACGSDDPDPAPSPTATEEERVDPKSEVPNRPTDGTAIP